MKPNIVFVDSEKNYIFPLAFKVAEKYGKNTDIVVLTESEKIAEFFSKQRNVSLLIADETLLPERGRSDQRYAITQILLTDDKDNLDAAAAKDIILYKYSALHTLCSIIYGHCDQIVKKDGQDTKRDARILLVTSMQGGVGKSLTAYSITKVLNGIGQRALYVDVEWTQNADGYLTNPVRLGISESPELFRDASVRQHKAADLIRKSDGIFYLPNVQNPLIVMNKSPEKLLDLVKEIAESSEYRFIVVDTDTALDSCKMKLLEMCTDCLFVVDTGESAAMKMAQFFDNFSVQEKTCYYICNQADDQTPDSMEFLSGTKVYFSAKIPVMDCAETEKVQTVSMQPDFQALGYLLN